MRIPARSTIRRTAAILASTFPAVIALGSTAAHAQPAPNPAADGYRLIYALDIPVASPGYHTSPVPYQVDASDGLDAGFDRVGYLMELRTTGGVDQWVWVTMQAFTRDVRRIGLPTAPSGASFQRSVGAMTVASNVAGLPTGDGIEGNVELWPNNYAAANGGRVVGASDSAYDFGDAPADPVAGYGSLQVHATASGTTLLAYNRWGFTDAGDIGIGNSPTGNPDWTFRQNAGDYVIRRLRVYVREAPLPAIDLTAPAPFAVQQRGDDDRAAVAIRGRTSAATGRVDVRAVPAGGFRGQATGWRTVALGANGVFSETMPVAGGWYRIEARAMAVAGDIDDVVLGTAAVEPVGVGEVFVTAGQSNSANHGAPRQTPADARIVAFGPGGWRPAADPSPSPPARAGRLAPRSATRWPARSTCPSVSCPSAGAGRRSSSGCRAVRCTRGCGMRSSLSVPAGAGRAVAPGRERRGGGTSRTVYAARLRTVIRASRVDAGYAVPWGIARVGFVPGLAQAPIDAIVAGQDAVIAGIAGGAGDDGVGEVFAGPPTDDIVGPAWRSDGIHFNAAGLTEHGRRWAGHVRAAIVFPERAVTPTDEPTVMSTVAPTALPTGTSSRMPEPSATPPAAGAPASLWLPIAMRSAVR
ncbi:MAG: hypothetical protein IPG72_00180 [Ardenticatenales bacterium]|nr:hypothetical protein [Ardenticatenales bacterium]